MCLLRFLEIKEENDCLKKGTVPATIHTLLENNLETLKIDHKEVLA